jgi:hypothetical protein
VNQPGSESVRAQNPALGQNRLSRHSGGILTAHSLMLSLLGQYNTMKPLEDPDADWAGVQPDRSRIEPLDANSFAVRLNLLSERARDLTILRNALKQQQTRGEQLPRDTEPI